MKWYDQSLNYLQAIRPCSQYAPLKLLSGSTYSDI